MKKMNSVFSAFKSGKNDKKNSKKHINSQESPTSYEKLRHLREVTSSSKMNHFVSDDDHPLLNFKLSNKKYPGKKKTSVLSPYDQSDIAVKEEQNCIFDEVDYGLFVDHGAETKNKWLTESKSAEKLDSGTFLQDDVHNPVGIVPIVTDQCHVMPRQIKNTEPTMPNLPLTTYIGNDAKFVTNESTANLLSKCNTISSTRSSSSNDTICSNIDPISSNNKNFASKNSNDVMQKQEIVNNLKKSSHTFNEINVVDNKSSSQLQLSSLPQSNFQLPSFLNNNRLHKPKHCVSNGFNVSGMPSVHGRTNNNSPKNNNGSQRTRLSTHQRNLSLDFR
jgi:hypothetical protein